MKFRDVEVENKHLQSQCQQMHLQLQETIQQIKHQRPNTPSQDDAITRMQTQTSTKLSQITQSLIQKQIELQMIKDYRQALDKYADLINELRGKVQDKEYSIFQQNQLTQTIYPYKAFIPTQENLGTWQVNQAYKTTTLQLMKELMETRKNLNGKSSQPSQFIREDKAETYLSEKSRKRVHRKLLQKISMENEKQNKLTIQYQQYQQVYTILKQEHGSLIREIERSESKCKSNWILDKIDEIEEESTTNKNLSDQ